MLDKAILDNNLNDEVSYQSFFEALGYKETDKVYIRTMFDNKSDKEKMPIKKEIVMYNFSNILENLKNENAESRGIFFVVNGGGDEDNKVKASKVTAKAQFIDFDDFPFDEQIERLNNFPLEPSIITKTKKSLHCYWILEGGDIQKFRTLQERLINYFGSDPRIKNESRVMRLYGFNHCKQEPHVMVKMIKFNPEIVYKQEELEAVLPELPKKATSPAEMKQPGEKIQKGHRHDYILKIVSKYLNKLKDSVDDITLLNLIETDYFTNCEYTADEVEENRNHIRRVYEDFKRKHREKADPGYYKKAVAEWEAINHRKFNAEETTWEEVERVYERSLELDKQMPTGLKQMKERNMQEDKATASAAASASDPGQNNLSIEEQIAEERQKELIEEIEQENTSAAVADLKAYIEESKTKTFIPTGFKGLDKILEGGLFPGLYIIGAISSLGKTTFCLQIADYIAAHGNKVLFFSLEMSHFELMAKSISRLTNEIVKKQGGKKWMAASTRDILTGARYATHNKTELATIDAAFKEYETGIGKNMWISEGVGNIGIKEIQEKVKTFMQTYDAKPVVFIDYLQVIAPETPNATDKQNTDRAVLALKRLSRDYDIPIVIISSFNRENYTAPVSMASFKESGAVEYTSDVLLGLQYNDMDYKADETEKDRTKRIRELFSAQEALARQGLSQNLQLKVLKNRNGAKGDSTFKFTPIFNYYNECQVTTS